jgi:hypothetical protein
MAIRSLSIEDRFLQGSTKISATGQKKYSDVDLSFVRKKNGDIFTKTDVSAVKQAVKNLILTSRYEKPFAPFFGTNIRSLLFELASEFITSDIKEEIQRAVEVYEPRIRVIDVTSEFTDYSNLLDVRLTFQVINTGEIVTIETEISRLR